MNDQHFFKEKLYTHKLPVRDGVWEAIEAKLPPKKDERRFPLFWFLLFTSGIVGGALMQGLIIKQENKTHNSGYAEPLVLESRKQSPVVSDHPVSGSSETINHDQSMVTSESGYSSNTYSSVKTKDKNQSSDLHSISHSVKTASSKTSLLRENNISNMADDGFVAKHNSTLTSYLPLSDVVLLPEEKDDDIGLLSLKPDPNCYKFSAEGKNYAISADFFAGPGFSPNSFEQTGGEMSVYMDARNATESKQYAWSAGARLNLHIRSGLAARIGILYEQTGDIFDYTDTLATQSKTVVDSFFSSDGTFLYADTNRVLIFGTLLKKIHNTYRRLDIPLLIGYEMPMGRSTLMVNMGPVINLTSSHKGQILDPMLHPRHITPGKPNAMPAYKTNLGLSFYISAGALFPLTDHISALVEPRFLYRIKPVTLDSYSLKEHRHYAGLNLGIRYHFK